MSTKTKKSTSDSEVIRAAPCAAAFQNQAEMLSAAEDVLGHVFSDRMILLAGLTHASGADSRVVSNEADNCWGLVSVSSSANNFIVSFQACSRGNYEDQISGGEPPNLPQGSAGLSIWDRFLILGRGMTTQAVVPSSVMAAVFESLIGALFLDGGLRAAKTFILTHTTPEIERAANGHHGGNYNPSCSKCRKNNSEPFPFMKQLFRLDLIIRSLSQWQLFWETISTRRLGDATRKEAEQRAALNAISQMNGIWTSLSCRWKDDISDVDECRPRACSSIRAKALGHGIGQIRT